LSISTLRHRTRARKSALAILSLAAAAVPLTGVQAQAATPRAAAARTVYVSPTGQDTAAGTAAHADELLASAHPIVTNLTLITGNITNPQGSLGEWLFPNLNPQLTQTVTSANSLLTNSDARLTSVALSLDLTLDNLANLTSNLHAQVQANTNLVGELSRLLIHTDGLVQGLKRHWLLRSAFKGKASDAPAPEPASRKTTSPRGAGR